MALETDRRSFLKGIAASFAAATMVAPQDLLAAIPEKSVTTTNEGFALLVDPENSLWRKTPDGVKTYIGQMIGAIMDHSDSYTPPIFGSTILQKLHTRLPELRISALVDMEGFILANAMIEDILNNPAARRLSFTYDNGVGKPFHLEYGVLVKFDIDDRVIGPSDCELSQIHMTLMA